MKQFKMKSNVEGKPARGIILQAAVLASAFLFSLATAFPAHAQATKIQQSEVSLVPASDADEHDSVGTAAAISKNGNTMIVGAVNADGAQVGTGAAFIFDKINGQWVKTATVFAADGIALSIPSQPEKFDNSNYGESVAISEDGNTAIIGAPGHFRSPRQTTGGAVYVYQRLNGVWSQQAELFSPTSNALDGFGSGQGQGGIGISGNTIAVTDQGSILGPSSVDVFTRNNGVWSLSTQLTVPDDFFFLATSVAIDGNTVVVGSTQSDSPIAFESGVAYVFRFSQGQWSGPVALAAADATSFAQFGSSMSLSGNTVVVGALTGPGRTAQSGAAYVFTNDEGLWRQRAKLVASDGLDLDWFGFSISTSGQTVIVGSINHASPLTGISGAGAAYIFRQDDGIWRQIAELGPGDSPNGGRYGSAVAVQGNTLLVGADVERQAVEGYAGGEAYVYRLNPQD